MKHGTRPIALVTGGARRLGRAISVALAERGMDVGVHYGRSDSDAGETLEMLERVGVRARAFQADLRVAEAAPELIRDVVADFGSLDLLVNSAAVMERTPFGETTAEQWDDILSLNLRAPFLLSQAAAPELRKRRGQIINIADLAAFETWPGYIPHGISKSGIVHLTRALARVLAPDIRVNAVAPGTVLLPDGWSEEDAARLNETTPLRRGGSPSDVIGAILYLLDAGYVTGETVIVDGGRHVRT